MAAAAISVEAATELVLSHTQELAAEWRPAESAIGLRLAAPVLAPRPHPPFRAAVKDGFAVCAAHTPGDFEVIAECRAGASPGSAAAPLGTREAAYITTGAALPLGADAVVAFEDVELLHTPQASDELEATSVGRGARFRLTRHLVAGHEVRAVGSDIATGSRLLETGSRLGAAELATLACIGNPLVQVVPAPRVAM